ncbi:MAG: hypothetical protein KGI37_08240 [Alphaproteobacteria bacterium]|nr:hypothetical protein [Alphaproteobacteria bacterium]
MLAGCATPQPVYKPVPVDMPVSVPCAAPPVPPPDFALSHAAPRDDVFVKTRAALAELDERKAYEAALRARMDACF